MILLPRFALSLHVQICAAERVTVSSKTNIFFIIRMQTSDAVITVHHDSGVISLMKGNCYKLPVPVPLCRIISCGALLLINLSKKPCEYIASRSTRSLHIIYVYRFQKKGNTTIYPESRVNRLSCQDMVFILTLSTANSSQVSSLGNTRFLETSNVILTTLYPFHAQFGGNTVREHMADSPAL